MKKTLSIALSVLLLFTAMPMSVFSMETAAVAESVTATNTDPTFTVDQVAGFAGDTVTVDVGFINSPGIVSLMVRVGYDADVLELLSCSAVDLSGTAFGPLTNNPFVINWLDTLNPNVTGDKTLARLTFKIKGSATEGVVSPITLTYDPNDVYDFDFNDVPFGVAEGSVTVYQHVTGITLNTDTLAIKNGDTAALTAIITPQGAYNKAVTWNSNNPSVATVNANGVVTGIKKGTATITATTVDGGYTATCLVDVACAHLSVTETEAKASTCKVHGHDAYTTCNDCGEIIAGSDEPLPLADHKGGTATCIALAICDVCGDPYGEYAPHAMTHYEAIAPDHFKGGNIEHWLCDACDGYFADSLGQQPIDYKDTLLNVIPHDHSNNWSSDDTQHWHECECGDRANVGEHVYDNACDAACICGFTREVSPHIYDGLHDADCNECGKVRRVTDFSFNAPATRVYSLDSTAVDVTGGWIEIAYEDGENGRIDLTADMVSGFNGAVVGTQTLTVTCGGKSATYDIAVMDTDELPTITVDSLTVRLDKEFTVAVRLENNPGIVSAKLAISYDESKLELISYEQADFTTLSYGPTENNPFIANWYDTISANNTTDGVFVLLTFKVKEDAELGFSPITVSYNPEDIYDYDFENVLFNTVSGMIEIIDYIPGDVNDDGNVNNKDLGQLQRYINGWTVEINLAAGDVTGDGNLNNKDLGHLQRYINGWSVELQ